MELYEAIFLCFAISLLCGVIGYLISDYANRYNGYQKKEHEAKIAWLKNQLRYIENSNNSYMRKLKETISKKKYNDLCAMIGRLDKLIKESK